MLTVLVMLVGILPQDAFATTISQGEEDQISRVEWLSDLVAAFNLYVEADNYPDNYYSDISEEDEFYRDIMLAVEFGAIDIEAGSEFRPNDCATREFAAQSLNALLGFVLENDEYTYSDVDNVVHKEAAQIAVNRGWFVLVEGAFLPNQPITNAEKTAMLGDAQEVLDDAVIEFDHQNTIECDEDVIFIPETTEVSIDTEGEVVAIKDNTQEITVGDVFVVYANEIPFAYKATDIDVVDEYTYISIEDAPDDTIINIDYQGSVDADMTQFVPADATTYSIDNYTVHESATRGVSYDGKTLKANKTVTIAEGVTATFNIIVTNMKVNYHLEKNNYYLSISGDLTYSCNVKGDAFSDLGVSHELILGAVPLGDIGFATIGMVYNLSGEATLTVDNTFESGFAYSNGLRYVGSYTVKVTFKGDYSGSKNLTFKINPKVTTVRKVLVASRKLTVTLKKQATQSTGYEVQVATNNKFTKNLKTTTITKNSKTSVSINSLKGNTPYYVRVRTYKKVGGKKFYSDWKVYSKKVKTKK